MWEITKLAKKGRIQLSQSSSELRKYLSRLYIWPISWEVCEAMQALDFHSDPADEIIAATSLAHGLPLLTHDKKILRSKKVPLWRKSAL